MHAQYQRASICILGQRSGYLDSRVELQLRIERLQDIELDITGAVLLGALLAQLSLSRVLTSICTTIL